MNYSPEKVASAYHLAAVKLAEGEAAAAPLPAWAGAAGGAALGGSLGALTGFAGSRLGNKKERTLYNLSRDRGEMDPAVARKAAIRRNLGTAAATVGGGLVGGTMGGAAGHALQSYGPGLADQVQERVVDTAGAVKDRFDKGSADTVRQLAQAAVHGGTAGAVSGPADETAQQAGRFGHWLKDKIPFVNAGESPYTPVAERVGQEAAMGGAANAAGHAASNAVAPHLREHMERLQAQRMSGGS